MEDTHGLDELNQRVLQTGRCSSCGACVDKCPYLTVFHGKTVMLDRCTLDKGRCFTYCPQTYFDQEAAAGAIFGQPADPGPIGRVMAVKGSRAGDPGIASRGQGGGTVTALLITALQSGLIDAAVVTSQAPGESFSRGMVATAIPDIMSCCGSKYAGSHSLSALKVALERGYEKIGVVGVPCQVRAVRKMALYDLRNEGLKERISLVVGLFCNWAFSAREFHAFLAARFDLTAVTRFHIPPPPARVLEVETSDRVSTIPLDELRPVFQAACSECSDMTSEFADVSVGMYEGKAGWNTLITRTNTGRDLVERALSARNLLLEDFPEANLKHLEEASAAKKARTQGETLSGKV